MSRFHLSSGNEKSKGNCWEGRNSDGGRVDGGSRKVRGRGWVSEREGRQLEGTGWDLRRDMGRLQILMGSGL